MVGRSKIAPHAVYRNKQFTATLQSHYWARCEPPAILDKSGSEKTSEHVFQTLLITPEDSAPWKSASRSSAKLCLPIPFHNGSHVRRALIANNASQAVHRKKQFTARNSDARYSLQKTLLRLKRHLSTQAAHRRKQFTAIRARREP